MPQQIDQQFIDDFGEAERLFKDGQLEISLKKYQILLKKQPDQIAVLNSIGLVYEKLGDFAQAVDYYKKCLAQQPDQIVLVNNLANAYTRLENWTDADPLLKRVVDAEFDHERNSEKYALCLFNIQSKEAAVKFINSVITKYPKNPVLNRLLGRSLLQLNQHVDGLRHLQKGSGFIEFNQDGVAHLN